MKAQVTAQDRERADREARAAMLAGLSEEQWNTLWGMTTDDWLGWLVDSTAPGKTTEERSYTAGYGRHVIDFRDQLTRLRYEGRQMMELITP